MRAHQRAAHQRRRGDGAAAHRSRRARSKASARTTLRVRCPEVVKDEPDAALVGRLRGSVLLLGPLLARRGRARLAPPGGDFPGAPHASTTHLEALVSMGARMVDGRRATSSRRPDGLKPTSIYLYEASVTGTETALLAAAGAPGVTEIRHAACEPHVVELCEFLQQARRRHHRRRARRRSASKAARKLGGARAHSSGATTSRRAAGRSSRRSPAARSRSAARAPRTWKSSPRC